MNAVVLKTSIEFITKHFPIILIKNHTFYYKRYEWMVHNCDYELLKGKENFFAAFCSAQETLMS